MQTLNAGKGCDLGKHPTRGMVLVMLNREQIDPVQARQLRGHLRATKLWYDLQAAEYVMHGTLRDVQFQRLIDRIEERALAVMRSSIF